MTARSLTPAQDAFRAAHEAHVRDVLARYAEESRDTREVMLQLDLLAVTGGAFARCLDEGWSRVGALNLIGIALSGCCANFVSTAGRDDSGEECPTTSLDAFLWLMDCVERRVKMAQSGDPRVRRGYVDLTPPDSGEA